MSGECPPLTGAAWDLDRRPPPSPCARSQEPRASQASPLSASVAQLAGRGAMARCRRPPRRSERRRRRPRRSRRRRTGLLRPHSARARFDVTRREAPAYDHVAVERFEEIGPDMWRNARKPGANSRLALGARRPNTAIAGPSPLRTGGPSPRSGTQRFPRYHRDRCRRPLAVVAVPPTARTLGHQSTSPRSGGVTARRNRVREIRGISSLASRKRRISRARSLDCRRNCCTA